MNWEGPLWREGRTNLRIFAAVLSLIAEVWLALGALVGKPGIL
jgi:hypothetical protein